MSGLNNQGFDRKRLADIKTEIEESLKDSFGVGINLQPESVFGQLVGILAERESLVWQLSEQVYNSQYPDTATGISLDNVAALTGITRLEATFSVVEAILLGTAATVVPAGTTFSVTGNPNARFISRNDVTLVAGTDEVQLISFSGVPTGGDFKITFDGETTTPIAYSDDATAVEAALEALDNIDDVTVTGDFTLGFTITFVGDEVKRRNQSQLTITDNLLTPATTITPSTLTQGVIQGSVFCDAEETGPIQAPADSLRVIDTPVFGLDSVDNLLDETIGRNIETDLELRIRRARTIQVAGAGTVESIRSRLLGLEGVIAALVFENTTFITDPDGRPPKSFEAVVQGGDDDQIANTIWLAKPAGIATYGNQTTPITDSQSFSHDILWSRPTEVDIWIDLVLTVDFSFNATEAQIKDALVDYANASLGIGDDVVVYPRLICVLDQFQGIVDVVIKVGTAPVPTLDDNIEIDPDEIASVDTSRITITLI